MSKQNRSEFCPFPDVPHYFKHLWDPATLDKGGLVADVIAPKMMIYGRSIRSEFEEDRSHEESDHQRGAFLARCFSENCPEGEVGFMWIKAVEEITEDEFNAALAGMREDDR